MTITKQTEAVSLKDVRIDNPFWSNYIELVRSTVIPYQYDAIHDRIPDAEKSYAIQNFRIAAGLDQGEFGGMVFQDSDVAKWLEAVGYSLQTHPDAELERLADEVIDIVARAQQPDGYLNTYFTIKEPDKRWTNLRECHELYCAGHMMEAAVAYYEATGKRKLLDVMCRFADYIDTVFGREPGKLNGYPGHQEVELALVKLYHVTGNEKYLKLSGYFLDERGREPNFFDNEWEKRGRTDFFPELRLHGKRYFQAHKPVLEQTEADGHAVRAVYMYSGMADIAKTTGNKELFEACKRLWNNMADKRMYVTGAIGSLSQGERFTLDYDLPNDLAYAETCASVGLIFFAYRMLKLEADSRYADVMERALYNTVLAGMSLDGKSFFYVNPLEVWPDACDHNTVKQHVKVTRQKWFGCACCPPNVARLLASLGQYIYTVNEDTAYVHLYIGGEADLDVGGGRIKLVQETGFPWAEKAAIRVTSATGNKEFALAVRLPDWAPNVKVTVNGQAVELDKVRDKGYAVIRRAWKDGDVVELELPMPIFRMKANPFVRADIGKVALQKGPFVYCLEEADNGRNLHEVVLPRGASLTASLESGLLGGVNIITAEAERVDESAWKGALYKPDLEEIRTKQEVKFIPYYAWANRGAGEMSVWVREL